MAIFWVAQRELWAKEGKEREVMITTHFMHNQNKDKASDYLEEIARRLNKLTDANNVAALLREAKQKVRDAQRAEKFLEEVKF